MVSNISMISVNVVSLHVLMLALAALMAVGSSFRAVCTRGIRQLNSGSVQRPGGGGPPCL